MSTTRKGQKLTINKIQFVIISKTTKNKITDNRTDEQIEDKIIVKVTCHKINKIIIRVFARNRIAKINYVKEPIIKL